MAKKIVGIIGGMGPLATANLFTKIITNTQAAADQDHLHVLIDSNTSIPDRTKALLHGGASPLPEMTRSAERLEAAGAELLAMPCNTAHCFYQQLCERTSRPVINMVSETVSEIQRSGIRTVGLLGTAGLVASGLYQQELEKRRIKAILPSPEGQAEVMRLIYDGVKAGAREFSTEPFRRVLSEMTGQGVQAFVLACTELPVAFEEYHIPGDTIDPTLILARAIIREAGGQPV